MLLFTSLFVGLCFVFFFLFSLLCLAKCNLDLFYAFFLLYTRVYPLKCAHQSIFHNNIEFFLLNVMKDTNFSEVFYRFAASLFILQSKFSAFLHFLTLSMQQSQYFWMLMLIIWEMRRFSYGHKSKRAAIQYKCLCSFVKFVERESPFM